MIQQRLEKYHVSHKFYKKSLLNVVCAIAGLSIFFFGYDQGVMGGVNTTRNYVETMGFGHWDGSEVVIDDTLKQGAIVSFSSPFFFCRFGSVVWPMRRAFSSPEEFFAMTSRLASHRLITH